jgi:hypothetical protein
MQIKWYHESSQEWKVPEDTEEKAIAIVEMLAECEAIEKALLAEGAQDIQGDAP